MKYAVIQLGGKQIQIQEGDSFEIERQSELKIDVLVFSEDGKLELGTPFLSDIEVKAKITGDARGEKIRIGRFKSKSRYRRIKGHRQPLSVVEIEHIGKKGAKKEKEVTETKAAENKVEAPKKVAKKEVKKAVKKAAPKKAPAKKSTSSAKKGAVKK